MAPKAAKAKADKTKKEAEAKPTKAAAKAAADTASSELALEAKKEQQNFVNTLKYRATKCNSTEAQQHLKAHCTHGSFSLRWFIHIVVQSLFIYLFELFFCG